MLIMNEYLSMILKLHYSKKQRYDANIIKMTRMRFIDQTVLTFTYTISHSDQSQI